MIMERVAGATALPGLDGFVAGAQVAEGREVWILVETTGDVMGPSAFWRESGQRRTADRQGPDLSVADRHLVLVWRKRTWRCRADLSGSSPPSAP